MVRWRPADTTLTDIEGKQLLAAFGVPVSEAHEARSYDEARALADRLGYPLVVKTLAKGLRYRATSGTVTLGIDGAVALRRAWQVSEEAVGADRFEGVLVERMYRRFDGRRLSAGVRPDPVFGPVLVLGHGGVAARHALHDRRHAVALPPLSRYLARTLIEASPAAPLLQASEAVDAVDLGALEGVLLRLSEIACELPCIAELELVNLVVDPGGRARTGRAGDAECRRCDDARCRLSPTWRYIPTRATSSRAGPRATAPP